MCDRDALRRRIVMKTPLQHMEIRTFETDARNSEESIIRLPKTSPVGGDYGRVRAAGLKNHQGWDLVATVGTPVVAISDGIVEWVHLYTGDPDSDPYGNQICLRTAMKRKFTGETIWAFYAHLLISSVHRHQHVSEGQVIGMVGKTGNAIDVPSHLHFEIRTSGERLGKGLLYRLNPGEILGYHYYACAAG